MVTLNQAVKVVANLRDAKRETDRKWFNRWPVLAELRDLADRNQVELTPARFLAIVDLSPHRLARMTDDQVRDVLADFYDRNRDDPSAGEARWGPTGGCVLGGSYEHWLNRLGQRLESNFTFPEKVAYIQVVIKHAEALLSGTDPDLSPWEAELYKHVADLFPEFPEVPPDLVRIRRDRKYYGDWLTFLKLQYYRRHKGFLPPAADRKWLELTTLYGWGTTWDGKGFPSFWFDPDNAAEAPADYLAAVREVLGDDLTIPLDSEDMRLVNDWFETFITSTGSRSG